MHLGQSIDLGNTHAFTVVPREGRIHAYASRRGGPREEGAMLTPAQAREAAATLIAIADDLDPPATTAVGRSTLGSPSSRAEIHVAPPKEG